MWTEIYQNSPPSLYPLFALPRPTTYGNLKSVFEILSISIYFWYFCRRDIGFPGDVFPRSSEWENIDVNVITNLRIGDKKKKKEEEEEVGDNGVMTRWWLFRMMPKLTPLFFISNKIQFIKFWNQMCLDEENLNFLKWDSRQDKGWAVN